MRSAEKTPHILLVEDSEDDAFFFQRIAKRTGIALEVTHVPNGLEAVEVLKKSTINSGAPSLPAPDLIFLDLKMPEFSGFEVLSWVQNQSNLPKLTIAVLSGSEDVTDIRKAKSLGAMTCFTKPIQLSQLQAVLKDCGLAPADNPQPSPPLISP